MPRQAAPATTTTSSKDKGGGVGAGAGAGGGGAPRRNVSNALLDDLYREREHWYSELSGGQQSKVDSPEQTGGFLAAEMGREVTVVSGDLLREK